MSVPSKKIKLPKSIDAWKYSMRAGGWVIAERARADGSIERVRMMATESRGNLGLSVHGRLWQGELDLGREGSKGGSADIASVFTAQFPGKVRKILVAAGQTVAEGDKVLLLEAMKMEFAIQAPVAGQVSKILVTEGKQVLPGEKFVEFIPTEAPK